MLTSNSRSVYSLLYLLFCLLYFSLAGHAQKNVLFPQGAGVVDVTKAPYFAKGDGITDDTDAINQAMLDHPDGHFIIYLPNGTYLVSDRIDWPRVSGDDTICGTEQSCRYTILQGQNRDSTIIKLKDNAAGYQDNTNRRAVLWCGQGVAQRFRNAVRDLTVNIGTGNAGASGIQFNANNQGGIFDVKVESNDGQGVYGIDLAYTNEIGPLLVKNVEVDGFQRAVSTNFNVNSMTFENLTIRNQSDVGIYVLQQVVTIRGLQSFNEVTAVRTRNQGSHLVLIDSELNGQGNASNLPAIFYGTDVFLRNVTTPGYRNAVSFNLNGTTPITRVSGDYIDEYVSSEPIRLCDNIEKSLNLPVLETPDVPVEDTTLWVNVEDFGARIDKTGVDDAAAIQAAMNSGASTIYIPVNSFRNGGYTVLSDISVPGTVRRIIGTEGGISGSGRFILIDGTDDLIIERVRNLGGGIIHDADRTLIVKSSTIRGEYSCSSGADLFLEDVGFPATTFTNQNVWARQYNTERTGISIINDNSNLWILGLKTEKSGTKIKTINGGRTEVLGAHIYSISESTDEFMFIVEDGSLSLAGIRETNFNNDPYPNLIKETRNGFTRELVAGQANFGINGSGFPLFVGYAAEGTNSAPTVSVGDDITLVFPLDSVSIIGEVNDDGLPGSQCFASHEWTQIAGPESAVIDDPLSLGTNIIFEEPGVYTFRLSASDGDLMASDDVNIYVYEKTITTADHDGDGAPSGNGADTYVGRGGGRAILNYGGATGIRIRNHPGIFDEKAYIKFDLGAIDQNILDAGFAIEISTTNTGVISDWVYNVFALEESDDYGSGKLNEMWQEGTETGVEGDSTEISYSNAPANINSGGGIYDSISNSGGGVDNNLTRFLGTFQLRSRTREVINFRSDELTQFLNEDTNGLVTLIITRVEASSNVIAFNPKENSTFSIPSLHLTLEQEDQFTCEGENVVFPADGNVVNVTQAPYFAIPDDGIDDTQAIQQALDDHPNGNFIIYLPNGVYNISNRLKWPLSGFGPNDFQYVVMQGQCTEGTILQLDDSAPGYQDPNARRPVVLTSDSFAEGATQGGNTRFRNSVRNLTIHTGTGNPGAVGLQFKANNTGTARDLKIISGDGLGVVGLELSHINDNGPLLVKNVEINGFDYGIRNNFNGLSQTFENITLRDQNVYGFFNFQQAIAVRGLVSFNEVPAFFQRDQGSYSVLVDSELNGTGDAINNSAIIFSDGFFVRNVQTSGYKVAVTERVFGTTPVTRVEGPYVEEYSSSDPLRACLNIEKSLNLSVQDEPEIPRGDIATDWVNIESFGATIDRNRGDDTQAIQAALNSGASTIYVPTPGIFPDNFTMNGDVIVPSTVRRIIGLEGRLGGEGRFMIEEDGEPLIIERFQVMAGGVFHGSSRTLVLKNNAMIYKAADNGAGDVYIEDVVGSGPEELRAWVFNNQNVWARQFNVENLDINIVNNGGKLWILGLKTEHRGQIIKTINGGETELLGALHLITDDSNDLPAYEVIDASLSIAGIRETSFSGISYDVVVRDTRNGITRDLLPSEASRGIGGFGLPLYVSYVPQGVPSHAPTVDVGQDITAMVTDSLINITAEVNDDGLPNGDCLPNALWTQLSGPGGLEFADPTSVSTSIKFEQSGVYLLGLTVDDGELETTDTLTVRVFDQAILTSEGNGADAAVLGPAGPVDDNFGGSPKIIISNNPLGFSFKAYLRFDISQLEAQPVGSQLAIELSTTLIGVIDPFTYKVYGLEESDSYGEGKLDEFWLEGDKDDELADPGEITFNNAPAIVNQGDQTDTTFTTLLGTFQLRSRVREVVRLNSDALTEFINRDSNGVITLIIVREERTQNALSFSSKEDLAFSTPTLNLAFDQANDLPIIGEVGESSTGNDWQLVNLNNTYVDPVVIMGPSSFFDDDKSTVRVRNVTPNSFEWQMDEWEYQDQVHGEEIVHYLVMETGEHLLSSGMRIVAGNSLVNRKLSVIDYVNDFDVTPVVLVQCASNNEAQAVTERVRNSSPGSFEVKLQEEENGGTLDGNRGHIFETVSWMAMESGMSSGTGIDRYEASATPDAVRHEMWYDITFGQSYQGADRAIFADMQTMDGGDPAVVRYNRDSMTNSFDSLGIEIFLEEELSNTTENGGLGEIKHATEVIGYLVFDGVGNITGTTLNTKGTVATTRIAADQGELAEELSDIITGFKLFPNPVTEGFLYIDLESSPDKDTYLSISDLTGKVLVEHESIQSSKLRVGVSDLKNGLYLVRAKVNGQVHIGKIFIER